MSTLNAVEQAAVAAISDIMSGNFCEKRSRDDGADDAGGFRPSKMPRAEVPRGPAARELMPAPYFYYRDHSMEADPDPLTPLTPPGRVPNFPAKMHAILSSEEYCDVVAWLPHGRSWRVLKPREFEIKVIPKFFEHAKFSSFVRQANGWGFRRITTGRDRNAYYHEQFLRGLPHLCKTMKRPGVNEKKQADPDHEPDFYKISEEHPIPEKADDDSVLLNCTLQGGPKARMPICWGSTMTSASTAPTFGEQVHSPSANLAPATHMVQHPFLQPVAASEMDQKMPASPMSVSPTNSKVMFQIPTFVPVPNGQGNASAPTLQMPGNMMAFPMPPMDAAAASQFAAGFAAATAFSQQHFSKMLGSFAAQQRQQQAQAQKPQVQQVQQPQVQLAAQTQHVHEQSHAQHVDQPQMPLAPQPQYTPEQSQPQHGFLA